MSRTLRTRASPTTIASISLQDAGQMIIVNGSPATSKAVARKIKGINPRYRSLIMDFVSGWVGGSIGIAATHPLDSIRVVKQYQARIAKNNMSYWEIILQIKNTYGLAGFYRGVIPPTVLRGFGLAANRGGYNLASSYFKGEKIQGTWRIWVVGGFAGGCAGVVDMPIQLLKCRAQVKKGLMKESFSLYAQMIKRIWNYEGILAFTNGLIPQLLYTIPSYAFFYAMYDCMVSYDIPVFVAGMVAGTVSWPASVPFDCLRVRMQCQPYNVSFRAVVKDMWRQPVRQWFSGCGATTLRAAPRWGVTMLVIENSNKFLKTNL